MRFLPFVFFAACSSAPPPLRQSCDTEATWRMTDDCAACITQTKRPRCSCDTVPAAGACLDDFRAWDDSADCGQAVKDCVAACSSDCTCVDGCYQAHATCRSLAGALQACVVKACDQRCR